MPRYDMVFVVKPHLPTSSLAEILKRAGLTVLDNGGVLAGVRSYGERPLVGVIRRVGEKFTRAHMLQVSFMANPATLEQLSHNVRVDERILRSSLHRSLDVPKTRESVLLTDFDESDALVAVRAVDAQTHAAGRTVLPSWATATESSPPPPPPPPRGAKKGQLGGFAASGLKGLNARR